MTFSLAGRCARTGMLGAVISTSSPAVGGRCMFARAGLGVVLTQHRTDPRLGSLGLELLAAGLGAASAVAALVAGTPHAGWRQLAVVDAAGTGAHFSGGLIRSKHAGTTAEDCVAVGNILRSADVPAAGTGAHFSGGLIRSKHAGTTAEDCVAVGNILRSADVPAAMTAAFVAASTLSLPERLLAALEAGDAAGGEERPLRSAALLVVHRAAFPYVDLRVDAAPEPIAAMRALWKEYAPDLDEYVARALDPDSLGPSSL